MAHPSWCMYLFLTLWPTSDALQVKYRPYMSPSEYGAVVRQHTVAALDGNTVHSRLAASIKDVQAQGKKTAHRRINWNAENKLQVVGAVASAVGSYLVNYNTVEAILLFCAVLVTLSGIMFESGRFEVRFSRNFSYRVWHTLLGIGLQCPT